MNLKFNTINLLEELKQTGIYYIVNKINNKVYIGSTCSLFYKRWHEHYYELVKNKHYCKYLQNAWNKYGKENFLFKIVEIIPKKDITKEYILSKEQFYIDNNKNRYNIKPKAENSLGHKLSIEARLNISKATKSYYLNENKQYIFTSPENIESIVVDLSTFCHKNNLRVNSVYRVIRKEYKHHKGWKCRKIEEPAPLRQEKLFFQKEDSGKAKPCLFTDPQGNEYTANSVKSFCKEHNLSAKCMARVASGQRNHHHKWKARYI